MAQGVSRHRPVIIAAVSNTFLPILFVLQFFIRSSVFVAAGIVAAAVAAVVFVVLVGAGGEQTQTCN